MQFCRRFCIHLQFVFRLYNWMFRTHLRKFLRRNWWMRLIVCFVCHWLVIMLASHSSPANAAQLVANHFFHGLMHLTLMHLMPTIEMGHYEVHFRKSCFFLGFWVFFCLCPVNWTSKKKKKITIHTVHLNTFWSLWRSKNLDSPQS